MEHAPNNQVVQLYISWTNTDIAPIRQLVGVKRISLISSSKSADVSNSHHDLIWNYVNINVYIHVCATA